jgi:ribonuclease HI
VIITDSFSTFVAIEGNINSKNPKTLSLRKLLDKETGKVILFWVPGHMGIERNEIVDEEAKATLEDRASSATRIPKCLNHVAITLGFDRTESTY